MGDAVWRSSDAYKGLIHLSEGSVRHVKTIVWFNFSATQEYLVPNREELAEEELQNKWYNKLDYAKINEEVEMTKKLLLLGLPERDGHCYRGLESVKPQNRRRRSAVRRKAWEAVPQLSKEQTPIGGDIFVSRFYHALSKESCRQAYERAVWDAKTVEEIWKPKRDETPRMPKRTWAKAG